MKKIIFLFLFVSAMTGGIAARAQTTDPTTAAAQAKADKEKAKADKKAARAKAKADKAAQAATTTATTPAAPAVTTTATTPRTATAPKTAVTQAVNKSGDKAIGTDSKGRTIYEGPRGGHYTLSKNGNKEYIKKN